MVRTLTPTPPASSNYSTLDLTDGLKMKGRDLTPPRLLRGRVHDFWSKHSCRFIACHMCKMSLIKSGFLCACTIAALSRMNSAWWIIKKNSSGLSGSISHTQHYPKFLRMSELWVRSFHSGHPSKKSFPWQIDLDCPWKTSDVFCHIYNV